MLLFALPVVFLLIGKTREQIQVWESPLTLWSHAVEYDPDNVPSRHNLAITYLNYQDYEKAAFYFGKNVGSRLKPAVSLAWRALSYLYLGRYDEALKDYIELENLSESLPDLKLNRHCSYFNNGWVYAQLGMHRKSAEFFGKVDQGSRLGPDAEIWLTWLKNNNRSMNGKSTIDELPSFCINLLPSMNISSR